MVSSSKDASTVTEFRFAEPDELEALEQLQRRAALATGDYREQILAHPDAIKIPQSAVDEQRIRVALRADRLVGFCFTLPIQDDVAEIDGYFVEPELFGQGIGRALILDAFASARIRGVSTLEVTANPRAIGFYETVGFFGVATAPTRFAPALRMRAQLDSRGHPLSFTPREIRTERLSLWRLYLRDFEEFRSDPLTASTKLNLNVSDGLPNFLHAQDRDAPVAIQWDSFWMIDHTNRHLVGACGCHKFPNASGEIEIAYGLSPDFEKKGYATEAARALVNYAFRRGDVQVVTALTHPRFNASGRVLTRCGFIQTGTAFDADEGEVWKWSLSRKSEE